NTNQKVYPGMIIQYTVSPVLNIPMRWVTEITHVKDLHYFVDEQRVGPYRIWHHEHHLKQIEGGVEMTDIVTYQPPMGILGSLANFLFIRKQLQSIFEFREKKLIELFGEMR
ncbi:MAG TPA: SRPBCC family protein, partial [Chitinophagales bacterium]|nr:SRPBCC family protein [Chitinophagales bacterium]